MEIFSLYSHFLLSNGISIDTRTLTPGQMFIGIKGEQFDGNQFARDALDCGARIALVDDPNYQTDDRILLTSKSGIQVLQDLAKYHVTQTSSKIIGITGSNGKTTTKELIEAVLSTKYKTIATIGNLNNHIGVPLTLLRINKDTEIVIIEMGANHKGEIAKLCQITEPDFAYITSFGKAHLEGFGSFEGVVKAKSELYDYVKLKEGLLFYNADDIIQHKACESYLNTYSFSAINYNTSDIQISISDSTREFLQINYAREKITTHLTGSYNLPNISAAIAMGKYFEIELSAIKSAIEAYYPTNNRSQILRIGSNTIISDAYNANPSSMCVALDNLAKQTNKTLAILGDMLELGLYAETEHQAVVDYAYSLNIPILCVGEHFYNTNTDYQRFNTFEELSLYLEQHLPMDTTILIKGSRVMRLERVVNVFLA